MRTILTAGTLLALAALPPIQASIRPKVLSVGRP